MSKDKEHKERIRAKRKKTRKKPIKNEENYFNMEFTVPKRKKRRFFARIFGTTLHTIISG